MAAVIIPGTMSINPSPSTSTSRPMDSPVGTEAGEVSVNHEDLDTDADSECSDHSDFSCFDDPLNDEPDMDEDNDWFREAAFNQCRLNFSVFQTLHFALFLVNSLFQSLGAVYYVLPIYDLAIHHFVRKIVKYEKQIAAAVVPKVKALINSSIVQRALSKSGEWISIILGKLAKLARSPIISGRTIEDIAFELRNRIFGLFRIHFPGIPGARGADMSRLFLALGARSKNQMAFECLFHVFACLFLYRNWNMFRQRGFARECRAPFLMALTLITLRRYIDLGYVMGIGLGMLYWTQSQQIYRFAIQAHGLTTWKFGIPVPWKGTEAFLSTSPFALLETRRWIDTRILGVRLKGRKIAMWKYYKIWYYAGIVFYIANAALVPPAVFRMNRLLSRGEALPMNQKWVKDFIQSAIRMSEPLHAVHVFGMPGGQLYTFEDGLQITAYESIEDLREMPFLTEKGWAKLVAANDYRRVLELGNDRKYVVHVSYEQELVKTEIIRALRGPTEGTLVGVPYGVRNGGISVGRIGAEMTRA